MRLGNAFVILLPVTVYRYHKSITTPLPLWNVIGVPKKELSVPDLASLDPVSIQDDGTLIHQTASSPNMGADAEGEEPPSF